MKKIVHSVIAFFLSKEVLKSLLSEKQEELSQIPSDKDVTNMMKEISSSLDEDKREKKTRLVEVLLKARTLLCQKVPCYFQHERIPTEEERLRTTGTSCFNCTCRSCVFHS